ncbi:MAG TPA: FHA domain-containing protein [Vicinamibacterales bacterium]|nr:FHA domain-containing protein [Vicinamibacterales bacterium]
MKILDKAAKLEKALLTRLSRRTDIRRHPIELYQDILDEIEDASEAGARGARIFPYNAITVSMPTIDAHHRATAEAVFAEAPSLEERVRARLRHGGCAGVDGLAVAVKFVDGTSDQWSGREYHIEYRRRATPRPPSRAVKARTVADRELHVVVIAGTAAKSRYSFTASRINLGRLADVLDRHQHIVRQNQVAFVDDDGVSQSVSRTHAHIRFDAATGEARLHDDGSTHGTRVVRGGRTLNVPRGGRGLTLGDGDEVLLGQARLRVELRPARRR